MQKTNDRLHICGPVSTPIGSDAMCNELSKLLGQRHDPASLLELSLSAISFGNKIAR